MAQPSSSILITPGTGETVATHTIDSKKYQAVIPVEYSGHFPKSLETFYYWSGVNVGATNKIHFDLFNAVGSGKLVRLRGLYLQCALADPDRADPYEFNLDKTSAVGSGGSVITGRSADSTNGSISASVTARHAPSSGATKNFTYFPLLLDPSSAMRAGFGQGGINWANQGEHVQDLVLQAGEGFRLIQITNNAVATWSIHAIVTMQ